MLYGKSQEKCTWDLPLGWVGPDCSHMGVCVPCQQVAC